MSKRIRLSEEYWQAFRKIQEGSLEDPISLISEAGLDKSTFFENGVFSDLDFTKSDITGVSFKNSTLTRVKLTHNQLEYINTTSPKHVSNVDLFETELSKVIKSLEDKHKAATSDELRMELSQTIEVFKERQKILPKK